MAKYKHIPTEKLEQMWNQRRLRLRMGEHFKSDMDEVYEMRRELDRRRGDTPPGEEINFEKYTTD